jgi:large subunit ribosomal protein L15
LDQVKGDEITPASLLGGGVVATADRPVKILAGGDVTRAFVVRSCAVSKNAREKIEQAGGRIEA